MRTHRSRRISRRTAERLLDGTPLDTRTAHLEPLADLLDAAAGSARPAELAGEQAAVAAFQAARLAPVPQPRRRSMIKTTLAKLLTVKVAAVAATAVAAGGVAVAAATGHLPTQSGGGAGPPAGSGISMTSTLLPAAHPASRPAAASGRNGAPGATPSPSLVGLCHAYDAGAGDHGKVLANPAFTVLVDTAGGKDRVSAYCAKLLAQPSGSAPSGRPHPTGGPNTHSNH